MKLVRISNNTFTRDEHGNENYRTDYEVEVKEAQDIRDLAYEYGQTDDTLELYDDAGELIAVATWNQKQYIYCYSKNLHPNPAWRVWNN